MRSMFKDDPKAMTDYLRRRVKQNEDGLVVLLNKYDVLEAANLIEELRLANARHKGCTHWVPCTCMDRNEDNK